MATTVVLTEAITDPSGRVRVKFDDGTEAEFQSLADLQQWAMEPDQDVDLAHKMCIAYVFHRSADLSNINSVRHKDFIFDLSHASVIRVR